MSKIVRNENFKSDSKISFPEFRILKCVLAFFPLKILSDYFLLNARLGFNYSQLSRKNKKNVVSFSKKSKSTKFQN